MGAKPRRRRATSGTRASSTSSSRRSRPESVELTDPLAQGRRLFNEGRYFEAHEAFEDAWRQASGDRKLALQALTQLAAGFHKLRQFGPGARGAKYLLEKSLEKLVLHGQELGEAGPGVQALVQKALSSLSRGQSPDPPRLIL